MIQANISHKESKPAEAVPGQKSIATQPSDGSQQPSILIRLSRVKGLVRRYRIKRQKQATLRLFDSESHNLRNIVKQRLDRVLEIDQPLALISQCPRSGGTLLNQLTDSHPELHVHPPELSIGNSRRLEWPVVDLSSNPEDWFDQLAEYRMARLSAIGYEKHVRSTGSSGDTLPFLFMPALQKKLFLHRVKSVQVSSQREVYNHYMTSFFNAWLDCQNLYTAKTMKKCVVGFTPRLSLSSDSMDAFFSCYPDGCLVTMARDPRSWYASAKRFAYKWGNREQMLDLWENSARATLEHRRRYGDKVYVIIFDDLLRDTESVMRSLADHLGIRFDPILLEPTFNGFRIKADSSYDVKEHGVIQEPLQRYRKTLTAEDIDYVERRAA